MSDDYVECTGCGVGDPILADKEFWKDPTEPICVFCYGTSAGYFLIMKQDADITGHNRAVIQCMNVLARYLGVK